MVRRLVVSDDGLAKNAVAYKVAVDGVVKPILRAFVADGGIVRQYWPYAVPPTPEPDPAIDWGGQTFHVSNLTYDPTVCEARIGFYRGNGEFGYNNYPGAPVVGTYLSPPVTGAGQYLIKAYDATGDTLSGDTLDVWHDIFDDNIWDWYLSRSTIGVSTATCKIAVAADDGTGNPILETELINDITFRAEVLDGGTDVSWSGVQRDLVEIKTGIDADCKLTFGPNGLATGDADTSGAFTERWSIEEPPVTPGDYEVTVDLISGDFPTGDSFGVPLTLDVVREWVLRTDGPETLTCALDVTVEDSSGSVTKRVTMTSERENEIPDPGWNTDPWSASDAGYPQGAGLILDIFVDFLTNGTATLKMQSQEMPLTTFETDDWFDSPPPDAGERNNYEVMVEQGGMGGSALPGTPSDSLGVWHNLSDARNFILSGTTFLNNSRTPMFYISVRKVGGTAIRKPVNITISQSNGETP